MRTVFKRWEFSNQDIEELEIEPEDFVYADPPYDVEFTTYSSGGFSWSDQERTAKLLASHPGPVVISNQATPRIVELYESLGFELTYLDGPRRISCTGDRSSAREVLAVKTVRQDYRILQSKLKLELQTRKDDDGQTTEYGCRI